jgi:prevent-host-death family protein
MKPVTIHAAKTHLSRLIERACAGEDVVIARGRDPVVRLVPLKRAKRGRRFGALRGRARVSKAFFEPLPPEELAAWE